MESNSIIVSIRCITYNQVNYIQKCLNGFVNQKTNFQFEAIIHDDASTDGTAEIIKEYALKYPNIIKPILQKENQWSKHNGIIAKLLQENSKGKYIAYCEGDDYWTDMNKLQKQVDYLESHPDYGLCYTQCETMYSGINKKKNKIEGGKSVSFIDLLHLNTIPTLTVLYRSDLDQEYMAYRKTFGESWLMGDYPRWLWFAANSKIHFIEEVTGVYRILDESASHTKDVIKKKKFIESSRDIRLHFCDAYSENKEKEKTRINNESYWNLFLLLYKKERDEAKEYLKNIVPNNFKSIVKRIAGAIILLFHSL